MKSKTLTALLSLVLVATGCKSSTSATGNSTTTATTRATSTSTATAGAASSTDAGTGCPTSNMTSFAKTKFVLHSGLAFGAFHRYIYKPYQAGTFKSGAHGRILILVKAGTAALFIKRVSTPG